MADCAVGLLVDLSEPSPEPVRVPKRKKVRSKNRKINNQYVENNIETKENNNPIQAVEAGNRRSSITLSDAPDVGDRILVDVTEKTVRCHQVPGDSKSPWSVSESDPIPLLEERFDFELVGSPTLPNTKGDTLKDGDEEVFFGPVGFSEKCMVASLKSEEFKPLSPLSSSQMAEIVKEAHTVAHRIANMMSTSSTDSDRSRGSSFSSPIARWKASKRTPKKETPTSKTPKGETSKKETQKRKTPKRENQKCKTPNPDGDNNNNNSTNQSDSQRRSARLRSETFTLSEEITNLVPDTVKQTLFMDKDPCTDPATPEDKQVPSDGELSGEALGSQEMKQKEKIETDAKQPAKEVTDSKQGDKVKKMKGLPKPTGLKRPSTRLPMAGNCSMHKSSSSESLASSQDTRTRNDSVGSEFSPDNCSMISDASDISTTSTASNVSNTSRSSKLMAPKGRLSTGLPLLGSKMEKPSSLSGLKRPGITGNGPTMNRSLDVPKKSAKLSYGEASKTGPVTGGVGLNRSLQMPSSRLNQSKSDTSMSRPGSQPGLVRAPRQSTPIGPPAGRPGSCGSKLAKPGVKAPETKQQLVRPGDIHRKTLAFNRSKQAPNGGHTGPLKATGPVRMSATPGIRPAVKTSNGSVASPLARKSSGSVASPLVKKAGGSVATPVKQNKIVQPKKLALSTSFDSPARPSPLSYRGVSCSSVGSYDSSIKADGDSVFDG